MSDRPYQIEAVDSVFRDWERMRSTVVVLPTGTGKNRVMAMIAERLQPRRCILLAHRSELIFQSRLAMLERGIECEIEMGELTASTNLFNRAAVVAATVQTLGSGEIDKKRMLRFDPMDFDALLYDEFHHAPAVGNKAIVDYFLKGNPNLKVCGLTATPKRADSKALGMVAESVAIQRDIRWGVDEGWLVEPRQRMIHCGAIDFSHIRTTAGDLNGADLAAVMEAEEPCQKVKQATLEAMFGLEENELLQHPPETWGTVLMARGEPKRTIVFTVTVKQAEQLCSIMNRVIPGIANFVHGKTPDYERDHMLASFKAGTTPCMINCDVLTEGYDNPFVELVVIAKPTKSLAKYIQFIGRETRVLPGTIDGLETALERIQAILRSAKPFATVLDFHGNAGKHKIKTLLDVLGGLMDDDLRAKVEYRLKQEKTAMQIKEVVAEEAEKLRLEIEQKRLAKEAERARLLAKVQYSSTVVSPFDAFDMSPPRESAATTRQLSDGQIKMLVGQKIDPTTLTYAAGAKLAQEIIVRMRKGLASMPQCETIRRYYPEVNVRDLSRKRASAILDRLAQNKWNKVDIKDI